jgi:hypothetical protein
VKSKARAHAESETLSWRSVSDGSVNMLFEIFADGKSACIVWESSLLLVLVMSPLRSNPLLHTAECSSSPLICHRSALIVIVLMPPLPSCTSLPLLATEKSQTDSHSQCLLDCTPILLVLMPPLPSCTSPLCSPPGALVGVLAGGCHGGGCCCG